LQLAEIDVNSMAAMAANGLLPLASKKGILLGPIVSSRAPRVCGDETRLLQVLHNLLANSVKFTPRGGRIDVSVSEHLGTVIIAVRDTGKGVSSAELPQLFTGFQRDRAGRSGLGLLVARDIVERHQGEIRAHSDGENQGTLMLVSLPAFAPKP
jgi:signal transduction histidine kinase